MDSHQAFFTESLSDLGNQRSIFGAGFVGFMRRLGMTAALTAGAGLLTLGYAHWESKQPVVRRFRVVVPHRKGLKPIRILHLSDLHMYPGQDFIGALLSKVAAEEKIDFVVSTGDNLADKCSLDLLLAAYEPLLEFPGAFVLGSNDYYSPVLKSWLSYVGKRNPKRLTAKKRRNQPDLPWVSLVRRFTEAGWVDLSNRADTVEVFTGPDDVQTVALMGVDDPHIRRDRIPPRPPSWHSPSSWRIALTHAPYERVLNSFTEAGADLILAGHTHGGQIRIPGFGSLVTNSDLHRRYGRGLHQWRATDSATDTGADNCYLHVSAGLGTSPFAPVRFGCRPEISLIEISG